jgi:heme exporter protein D
MNWGSPAEFFAMGGYAFYVWGSYSVTVAALIIEVVGLHRRRRQALQTLRRTRS